MMSLKCRLRTGVLLLSVASLPGVCITEHRQHYRQYCGTGLYQLACQRDLLLALLQRVWLYGQNFREGDTFHPGSGYFHLYGTGW